MAQGENTTQPVVEWIEECPRDAGLLDSYGNQPYKRAGGTTMHLARTEPSSRRAERLEARVTAGQKRLLQAAAAFQGRTLTDFVVGSLVETATRVLQERELVVLGTKDREVFVRALLNPPTLKGGRLARAVQRYRRATK